MGVSFMNKTAVLLYPQFSEYELSVALSILMQGEKPVVTVGLNQSPIKGEASLTCLPDETLDSINIHEIDSLLLPGCMNIFDLEEESKYIEFIKQVASQENIIMASISSSPLLLAKAGILKNKKYTVGLLEKDRDDSGVFEKANYVDELVVQDGNIITAFGSGFIPFGIAFGKALQLTFSEGWYRK